MTMTNQLATIAKAMLADFLDGSGGPGSLLLKKSLIKAQHKSGPDSVFFTKRDTKKPSNPHKKGTKGGHKPPQGINPEER